MKVYYAHSMHLYGAAQEFRDVELLEKLGFKVLNPNSKKVQAAVEDWKREIRSSGSNIMSVFVPFIKDCELLAFRAYMDGTIGSGVAYEIDVARQFGMPIIELPNLIPSRMRSYEDTKVILELLGER